MEKKQTNWFEIKHKEEVKNKLLAEYGNNIKVVFRSRRKNTWVPGHVYADIYIKADDRVKVCEIFNSLNDFQTDQVFIN